MPRKYRPPAARRRKAKKQGPVFVEPVPQSDDAPQSGDGAVAVEGVQAEPAVSVATVEPSPPSARVVERSPATSTKHIARDYSYVRAEVRRIVLVGGFLIASLVVTALLRN